jgi:dTDP-4-amino-4,6-dideoxygalactose transaminase
VAGLCERLDGLQAAFLSAKLPTAGRLQGLRDDAVHRYEQHLASVDGVTPLATDPNAGHAHHLLVVRVPHRDRLLKLLHDAGVGAAVHYPVPIHLQPATAALGARGQFPASEELADSVLSLPRFPGMTPAQIDRCVEALTDALARVA